MKLFTKAQFEKLIKNGHERGHDHKPVVKLFTPDANATWLLTEIDPEDQDIAFGLCDLGLGFPELGPVSLSELHEFRGPFGLKIERDLSFGAAFPLSVYTEAAAQHQRITESQTALMQAQTVLERKDTEEESSGEGTTPRHQTTKNANP